MEKDLREAILRLVEASKEFQVLALSQNTALMTILALDPAKRAALTRDQIQAAICDAHPGARQTVEQVSASLLRALVADKGVLEEVLAYPAMLVRIRPKD